METPPVLCLVSISGDNALLLNAYLVVCNDCFNRLSHLGNRTSTRSSCQTDGLMAANGEGLCAYAKQHEESKHSQHCSFRCTESLEVSCYVGYGEKASSRLSGCSKI